MVLCRRCPPPAFRLQLPILVPSRKGARPAPSILFLQTGKVIPAGILQIITTICRRSLEVGVPVVRCQILRKFTAHIGIVGGVVGLAILSSLIWFYLRRHSRKALFCASRQSSYRTLSTRQSYYPPSVSVYSSEPEMDENGNQYPGIYVRFFSAFFPRVVTVALRSSFVQSHSNPASPRESMYSHHGLLSILNSAESDMQTTHFSTPYGDRRRYDERTEF